MTKIFQWICPNCNKIIESIYLDQFVYNKEEHIKSHKRKNTSKGVGEKE